MATVYCTATSLDGFIADDEESLSWLFATPNADADLQGRYGDADTLDYKTFIQGIGAIVMGRNTYREDLERDGQLTAMRFRVVGPEPQG